jgi:hypothetical protein
MSVKTLTLASIYELQGLKEEAIGIYQDILTKDSDNAEAKLALIRLSGNRRKFEGANKEMIDFFVRMDSEAELAEFERYLIFA